MRFYLTVFIFVFLASILMMGCSGNESSSPVVPDDNNCPTANADDNRPILTAGTIEIDVESMTVRDVTDRVEAYHFNITSILGHHFKWRITEWAPPYITLNLEIENPTALQVWDVRIIYTNLFGKEIVNFDGFTSFYAPDNDPTINPFHYFAKEYPLQAFPVGPGVSDNEEMVMYWPPGASCLVSYVIECSLFHNAEEAIKIHGFSLEGDITPETGAAILSCEVEDWQDDVFQTGMLPYDFHRMSNYSIPMYQYRDTNKWMGNILNTRYEDPVPPGDYKVWTIGESPNPDDIQLGMPVFVNIPDTTDKAPRFNNFPHTYYNRTIEGMRTQLLGGTFDRTNNPVFLWEQISPAGPHGIFEGTTYESPYAFWIPPQVDEDTEFLLKITSTQTEGPMLSSSMILALPVELALPPEITEGPTCEPNPILENTVGSIILTVIDPNGFVTNPNNYNFIWEQVDPADPVGVFLSTSFDATWEAPEVDEDTEFTLKVTIEKDWLDPILSTEAEVQVTVLNND